MFEFFIARRYIRSKHKINLISIISILSTAGITIGVAALVVVLSVFNGFGGIVKSILINIDPHMKITIISEEGNAKIEQMQNELKSVNGVKESVAYAEGKVLILKKRSYEIVNLKGVENNNDIYKHKFDGKMFAGDFDISSKDESNIIVGLSSILQISGRIDDTLSVISANNIEQSITGYGLPATGRFIIKGVFQSNNKEYDASMVITDIASAQRVLGMQKRVSGLEVYLNDVNKANEIRDLLQSKFSSKDFSIDTWYDLHKDLYNVMLIERWSAYIILCLIIAVATFNILGSLSMTVIEKKKDIGVLRAMGANSKSILKVFMFEGMLVGAIGTIAGLTLGLLICFLQIKFNFYPLDPLKYVVDAMPVEIVFTDVIAIGAASFILTFFAAFYPAKKAAKLNAIESIKWE
jgi:lipoprotein-releasing system permease protein